MSCEAKENCENIYLAKDLKKVADEYIFNKKTLKNFFTRTPEHHKGYCQLNLNYSDFTENSGSSKLRINTLQVYF